MSQLFSIHPDNPQLRLIRQAVAIIRDGGVVVDRMRSGVGAYGFDAGSGTYVDLVEGGIVDPTKVVRVALENAVSVAGTLLLTDATLTEVPEAKKESPATADAY